MEKSSNTKGASHGKSITIVVTEIDSNKGLDEISGEETQNSALLGPIEFSDEKDNKQNQKYLQVESRPLAQMQPRRFGSIRSNQQKSSFSPEKIAAAPTKIENSIFETVKTATERSRLPPEKNILNQKSQIVALNCTPDANEEVTVETMIQKIPDAQEIRTLINLIPVKDRAQAVRLSLGIVQRTAKAIAKDAICKSIRLETLVIEKEDRIEEFKKYNRVLEEIIQSLKDDLRRARNETH